MFTYMPYVSLGAAESGRIDVLLWAQEHGVVLNKSSICERAARGGHLDTLKWLRERGCPWDAGVLAFAKTDEIAQWAS